MLKIIATIVMSLFLLAPAMAQDETCLTPEGAFTELAAMVPDVYEVDRLEVTDLGVIVFYASPSKPTLLAVYFNLDLCFIGEMKEITKEDYRAATGKVFVDASDDTISTPRT